MLSWTVNLMSFEPQPVTMSSKLPDRMTHVMNTSSLAACSLKDSLKEAAPLSAQTAMIQSADFETSTSRVTSNVDLCVPVIFLWPDAWITSLSIHRLYVL